MGTDGSVCLVEGERAGRLCLAVGGAPAHVPAGCPPGESGLVPSVVQAIAGLGCFI